MSQPALTTADVVPGNWFVVSPDEQLFRWIELGQTMIDRRRTIWGHAGVATRWKGSTLMIAEAEPGGAVERPWHWEGNPHLWSTAAPQLSVPGMADSALRSAGLTPGPQYGQWTKTGPGIGYSFLDYGAIEAHAMHLDVPGLREYIADTGHAICSQLVDLDAQDNDVHLFGTQAVPPNPDRWNGYVKPSDLGWLLAQHGIHWSIAGTVQP